MTRSSGARYFMLTLLAPIETQGSEHWVFIEREYIRPEELSLLKVTSTQQEGSDSSLASILADGRLSKADILVDKFKVEVATEEKVGARRANAQRPGRMIASPEDFESMWEEALWARGCPERTSLAPGSTPAGRLPEGSQFRVDAAAVAVRRPLASDDQLEGLAELRQELEEFQARRRPTAPGIQPAEGYVPSPASDTAGLRSFLLDPTHTEARADSSDETDASFAEGSFYFSCGERDAEGQVLPPPLEEREEHLDVLSEWETRLKLVEGLTERLELDSSGPWGSAAAGNKHHGGVAPSASPEDEAGPPRNHRPEDLEVFDEQLGKGPSPGLMFAEDGDAAQCGVEGEAALALSSEAAEEEAPKSGDLMGKAEKSPPGERNHSPHRRGAMRPDPQVFALPWAIPPGDIGKPARPDRGNFLPKERGPVHTQTGEPAAEDSKVPAFLQMEVITPLPTSPLPSAAQTSPEAASASSSPRGLGDPVQLRDPFGEQPPVFLKYAHPSKESLEPKHRVGLAVTPTDGGERRAPPVASRKPRIISEEAEGLVFPAGKHKEMPSLQAGGQEGSLEDISKTSVANKIRIFETHGAETRRTGLGETRAFAHELSSEASTGQAEQQGSKRFDLGCVQFQPLGDLAVPTVTQPSTMPLAPSRLQEGVSTSFPREGRKDVELVSSNPGCETTLEEAPGGTGHVSPRPHRRPWPGS